MQKIQTYLQRMTNSPVDQTTVLKLSSAQRAAFASWMNREGVSFAPAVLRKGTFSLTALLDGEVTATNAGIAALIEPAPSTAPRHLLSRLRVGIDLENVSSLPDATDYREHDFYRDNFTPEEIAYCLQMPDAKTSLCGLWAAKEAIAKTKNVKSFDNLRAIEIRHENGKPVCDGGDLSISHSGEFCVAVFVALG